MKLLYVLPTTEFGGGIKVAFEHAEILRARGHEVTVRAPGGRPEWADFGGRVLDALAGEAPGRQDLVVGTFWTTIQEALDLECGPVVHFCQGFEGGLEHLAEQRQRIEDVYRLPLATWVTNPSLGESLHERFGRSWRVAPPPLDPRFRPLWRWRPRRPPRILLPGIFEAPVKGVEWGLRAVVDLERRIGPCLLVRTSMLPLSDPEASLREAEVYLVGVTPERVAAEMRQSDLLLFPSRDDEGFGLPLLEAMASRLPAVASDIGSVRFMAPSEVARVPFGDAAAMAEEAEGLLRSPGRWRQARRRGAAAARRFERERVGDLLEEAVAWAAENA